MPAKDSFLTTKRRILNAAVDLFSERGYHGVSVRDITGRVGIRESSLYNHFKSKKDILEDIFHLYLNELDRLNRIEAVNENGDGATDLKTHLKSRLKKNLEFWDTPRRRKIRKILSMEQYRNTRASEIVMEETGRRLRSTENIFQAYINKGDIPAQDPQILASEYTYSLRAMHTEYALLKADAQDTKAIRKKMFDHIHFFLERL